MPGQHESQFLGSRSPGSAGRKPLVPSRGQASEACPGVLLLGPSGPETDSILTPAALAFVASLQRRFGQRRADLLAQRLQVQQRLDQGWRPGFLASGADIRAADWTVAAIPHDLLDRRVEITGPVDRKMIINALNSGASVFMADFEDANAPTWSNLIEGQLNLRDAVHRSIDFTHPATGKRYELADRTATLMVRPRGWHLPEKHVLVDGKPISGSLFDFGLFFFHNARALVARGSGPYFYLPKLENHQEARLWNDVFVAAQEMMGIPHGTIRATVLIETILAAFQMDEILYELRDHSAGLNCGRWDYIFSFIKRLRADPSCVLPDRSSVGMTRHFLRSYSLLLIATCHRRGAHAMGGMAAQIPIRGDEEANSNALSKVRSDKQREVGDGHDGTWVAHPALVPLAREIFDAAMPSPNQIHKLRLDVAITPADLLAVPEGDITEAGLRQNIHVGILYLEAWLRGAGCVPLYHLMEDAATSEISRTQVWQWIRHGARLADGRRVDEALFQQVLAEELATIRALPGSGLERLEEAAQIFASLITAPELAEFLTLPAYEHILTLENGSPVAPTAPFPKDPLP